MDKEIQDCRYINYLPSLVIFVSLISGCTSNVPAVSDRANWAKVHKFSIVNSSKKVISTIEYKPCGTKDAKYNYLTGNLRPQEKLTINLHTQCVDLRATSAFKKKMAGVKNVNLNSIRTWTIK